MMFQTVVLKPGMITILFQYMYSLESKHRCYNNFCNVGCIPGLSSYTECHIQSGRCNFTEKFCLAHF